MSMVSKFRPSCQKVKPSLVHTFGNTRVRLCDRTGVDKALLDNVFSYSGLDETELLLVLDDINMGDCGPGKDRGWTLPSHVLNNAGTTGYDPSISRARIDPFAWLCQRIPVGDLREQTKWDAVVYLPEVTAKREKTHAPYFVLSLAHELEHVRIMRENLQLHMCLSWLYKHNCQIFTDAGPSTRRGQTWNFPHEHQCHRKGKATAITIFGEDEFRQSLTELKKIETREHTEVLDFLLLLDEAPYQRDISKRIVQDLQNYYRDLEPVVHEIRARNQDPNFNLSDFIPVSAVMSKTDDRLL